MDRLRYMQKMFLVYAFGGPEWNGKNMRTAHKNLKISENHFNAVI